ncbi:hypothetical protein [Asanoa iriomotensis]|uniref:Uncharacterized protein n=1 Tax=Asanoa iriomotensis TaxID=234613 RepID=A0ABQ4C902_9ACTN|nr:hypothetical protein [Asanoa iriomotensis]GIF59258.1 hypothetical protein Air01nite_53530 [Asanoa iriomotensis]
MTPPARRDSDLAAGRQDKPSRRVANDTTSGHRDRDLSRDDTADRPNSSPNESSYAAAPPDPAPLQRTDWTPGNNQLVHLTLTRPDTTPMTPEQRRDAVALLTAMILDHLRQVRGAALPPTEPSAD